MGGNRSSSLFGLGGGGAVVVGECQFVKMEKFGKNISILTNFCQNTAREARERQAGSTTHNTPTLLILSAGGSLWGTGLGLPAASWYSGAFRHCQLPASAAGAAASQHSPLLGHDRKSSAFSFLTFKIGEKGLKRELGAHCWGQTRGSEEGKHQGPWARGLCPRLPQPHVWMSWCVALREGPQLQLRPHRTRTGSPPCRQLRQLRTTSTQVQFFKPN